MIQNLEEIEVSLDKRSDSTSPQVILRQGDVNGTVIRATITDSAREEVDLSGASAWFEMLMPDETSIFRTNPVVVASGNVVEIPIDESLAGISTGNYKNAYVRLVDSDGNKSSTASFTVKVIPGIDSGAQTIGEYVEEQMEAEWEDILNGDY